jgi:hypothetical protein
MTLWRRKTANKSLRRACVLAASVASAMVTGDDCAKDAGTSCHPVAVPALLRAKKAAVLEETVASVV